MQREIRDTDEQIRSLHSRVCSKCYYFDKHVRCCDYILLELKRRPCRGSECVSKGVFRKGRRSSDAFGLRVDKEVKK